MIGRYLGNVSRWGSYNQCGTWSEYIWNIGKWFMGTLIRAKLINRWRQPNLCQLCRQKTQGKSYAERVTSQAGHTQPGKYFFDDSWIRWTRHSPYRELNKSSNHSWPVNLIRLSISINWTLTLSGNFTGHNSCSLAPPLATKSAVSGQMIPSNT